MLSESDIVLWDDQMEALGWLFDLDQLEDLHVVLVDFTGQGEWTDVDDIDVGVLDSKDSHDLIVLLLLELFDGHSPALSDRVRVDMYLDTLLLSDLGPLALELGLHVAPDCPRLIIELMNLELGLLFQHVEAVLSLYGGGLGHQEL